MQQSHDDIERIRDMVVDRFVNLVDWVRDGRPTAMSADLAAHIPAMEPAAVAALTAGGACSVLAVRDC